MKSKLNKKHYSIISQDRTNLTDYEKDQLIPEIKSRLEVLKNYFYDVIRISDDLAASSLFTQNLYSILNPTNIESQENNAQILAQNFFDGAKNFAKIENIDDIDRILKKYQSIEKVHDIEGIRDAPSYIDISNAIHLSYTHMISIQLLIAWLV